jgi:hypothetical protein
MSKLKTLYIVKESDGYYSVIWDKPEGQDRWGNYLDEFGDTIINAESFCGEKFEKITGIKLREGQCMECALVNLKRFTPRKVKRHLDIRD